MNLQGKNSPQCVVKPAVSVAMATYNGARFIAEQLRSISRQTILPYELVISDDGSNDDTLEIVRAFAVNSPFEVRILDKKSRLGFADNFLFAAENCDGDIVMFADQDDVWLPSKLEVGLKRILADDSLLSMHQLTMTDQNLHPSERWDQGIDSDRTFEPLELDPWSGWGNTMMFRRELATLVPRHERPRHPEANRLLSHDTWLYVLAGAMGRISHIAQPLILYRQHDANACGMLMPGWRGRLRIMTTVPIEGYRERDLFFGALAKIFDGLAERTTGADADRASAAAKRYRERRLRAQRRLLVHEGATIAHRIGAFASLYRSPDPDLAPARHRMLSAVKDFALGVLALGSHNHP